MKKLFLSIGVSLLMFNKTIAYLVEEFAGHANRIIAVFT